jgi:WD40 repeat protein
VRFSPDGQRFVTAFNHGGSPQARDVQVWNAATGEQILALRGHDAVPTSATYSPDGRWVVTGSVDQTIKIWNAATGEPMWTLRGHTGPVYSVDVSPDGTLIASGGEDTTIRLWDTVTKRELAKLRGQTSGSYWLVFSPDSRKLASCAWPSIEIRVWDLAAVQPDVRMLRGHFYPLTGITFSPDGRQIASIGIDGTIRLWDVATGQPIRTLRRPGEWLCATAYFIVHRAAEWLYDVAYDPKGELLASGGMDREVTLWNVASGQEVQKLRGHQGDVRSVAFSPDGSRVATGSDDGTARVWNVATGQVLLSLEGHGDAVRQVAFSPDGARIASCSADKTLRLWDAVTGMELRTLSGHEAAVTCLAVSWKGKWIASGSEDGTIKIWNSVTGQEDRSLRGHGEVVLSVTFTTDDERVFSSSSDATVKLWDRTSGQELITLLENTWFPFVAVSRDGKTVAAAADDATIRIWEAAEPSQGESPTRLTAEIASRLVDARFKQLSFASDVIESLRTDDTLSEARRGVALEIATARGDNIVQLTYESWAIVRASGHDIDTYRRALHKAEVVSRLAPQSTGALDTLGVAHYRVGNYADALAILERAEQLRAAVPGSDREIPDEVTGRRKYPVVATNAHAVAFIAMSLHRLGRADEARAALDRLRTLVEKKMWSTDATAKQFLVEAEQLVD